MTPTSLLLRLSHYSKVDDVRGIVFLTTVYAGIMPYIETTTWIFKLRLRVACLAGLGYIPYHWTLLRWWVQVRTYSTVHKYLPRYRTPTVGSTDGTLRMVLTHHIHTRLTARSLLVGVITYRTYIQSDSTISYSYSLSNNWVQKIIHLRFLFFYR